MSFLSKIRPIAVIIIRRNDEILVCPKYDNKKDWHFFRLIGGGIEFGENSLVALKREVEEELNKELKNIKLLDVSENIFTYKGRKGHEICFIYQAEFKNKSDYKQSEFVILDKPQEKAIWVKLTSSNLKKITPPLPKNLVI